MAEWWTIEVLDGDSPASAWGDAHLDPLVETALASGALDWNRQAHSWGVLLELRFEDEADWERFRASAAVQAALDAVPDPVRGLLVHRGRGGSSGTRRPRRPQPLAGAGAVALPLPDPWFDPLDHPEPVLRRVLLTAGG